MKTIYTFRNVLSIILLIILTSSCVNDDFNQNINTGISNSKKTLEVLINIPEANKQVTRSMNESQTAAIDLATLKVLLFKDNNFLEDCKVNVLNSKEIPNSENKKYKIVISVPEKVGTEVDLHFFANSEISTPDENESIDDFLKRNTFTIDTKWDIENAKKIPMWGAIKNLNLDEATKSESEDNKLNVKMLRSLARIDLIQNKSDESSSDFTITEAYIYRSNNKGFIAPIEDFVGNTITKASVPSDVEKLEPIIINYTDPSLFIGKSGIALIAEQEVSSNYKENVCLVVKIKVEGGKESFYKINFHKKNDNGELELIEILRNHRYIVTVSDVSGDGSKSVEEAANSGASNIETEILVWDQNINYGFVSGSLYFGLNTNNIKFDNEEENQIKEIDFQTNLTDQQLDDFAKEFKWTENKDAFEISLDKVNHKIILKTKMLNTSHEPIIDKLVITRGEESFTIEVEQPFPAPEYTIVAEKMIVNGLYQVNTTLTDKNNIVLTVESNKDLTGSYFELYTEEIDYISFRGNGKFESKLDPSSNLYYAEVKLIGSGTPKSKESKIFNIKTNSKFPATFPVRINMAYSPKFIVAIENSTSISTQRKGNLLNAQESSKGKGAPTIPSLFRTSKHNFGLEDYSTIKVPELNDLDEDMNEKSIGAYIQANNKSVFRFVKKPSTRGIEDIIDGTRFGATPDIMILGGTLTLSTPRAKKVAEYLIQGGSVLYLQSNANAIKRVFQGMYNLDDDQAKDDFRVKDILAAKFEPRKYNSYNLSIIKSDPIYNGPFGNLNGKNWGGDKGTKVISVKGLPENDIIIYSDNVAYGLDEDKASRGVSMFRHTDYNLIFIGNEDFISNNNEITDVQNNDIESYPFDLEKDTYKPVPKKYGFKDWNKNDTNRARYTEPGLVYNSPIIGNMLAYLIDQAEFNGINSKK